MCTVMSSGLTPRVLTMSWRPGSGSCVGAQISSLPSGLQAAVQFIGSIGEWLTKG